MGFLHLHLVGTAFDGEMPIEEGNQKDDEEDNGVVGSHLDFSPLLLSCSFSF
jgi:hypothetical protein